MNSKRSRLGFYALLGVAFIVVAFVVSDILVRDMARERIEGMIVSSLKTSGDVVVDISVFPALKALNGRIDSVYIHAQDVTIGEVPMSEIEVDAKNVAWPVGLGQDEIMDLEDAIADGKIKIVMSEDDVNDGIISKISGLSNFRMSLKDGKSCMNGRATILSLSFNLFAEGIISAGADNTVNYSVERIGIEDVELTDSLLEIARALLNFKFSLPKLPFALKLGSIDIQDDVVVIRGSANK